MFLLHKLENEVVTIQAHKKIIKNPLLLKQKLEITLL